MKRYPKFFLSLSLVFLLSFSLVSLASAEVIRGQGWLHATGRGAAILRMSGQLDVTGHGSGVAYIYGAETVEASGTGQRTDLLSGGVILQGYEGTIQATGTGMLVKLVGQEIDFTAQGQGTAVLRGQGQYETGSGSGTWSDVGVTVSAQ